jgi:hypothetical protein
MVVLAAAACGKPAGVDGDLVNHWPAMGKAETPVPVVGACYDTEFETTWSGPFDTVPCTETHQTETSYVGAFTGDDAGRSSPPGSDSQSRKTAYLTCADKTADYLGGDWHTAYVWMGLVEPSPEAWTGGARWFRCDLMKTTDVEHTTTSSDSSLKDGLRGTAPAAITCINTVESNDQVQSETPANCATAHNGELTGVITGSSVTYPGDTAAQNQADSGCEASVAHYLGLSGSKDTNSAVGWLFFWPRETQWDSGDRAITCYAYAFTSSKKMTGSVKGLGNKAPKG